MEEGPGDILVTSQWMNPLFDVFTPEDKGKTVGESQRSASRVLPCTVSFRAWDTYLFNVGFSCAGRFAVVLSCRQSPALPACAADPLGSLSPPRTNDWGVLSIRAVYVYQAYGILIGLSFKYAVTRGTSICRRTAQKRPPEIIILGPQPQMEAII